MEERESPNIFLRLAFRAVICGAGLVTVYAAVANMMLHFGLAPR